MPNLTLPRHISTLRNAVIHCVLGDRNPRVSRATVGPLTLSAARHLGMNLAPVQGEHAHSDGTRRPVCVGDQPDRSNSISRIGEHLRDDAGRSVKE
jgi:hypothetical protein